MLYLGEQLSSRLVISSPPVYVQRAQLRWELMGMKEVCPSGLSWRHLQPDKSVPMSAVLCELSTGLARSTELQQPLQPSLLGTRLCGTNAGPCLLFGGYCEDLERQLSCHFCMPDVWVGGSSGTACLGAEQQKRQGCHSQRRAAATAPSDLTVGHR